MLPLSTAYGMTLGVTIAALCRARLVLFPTVDMGLITKAMKKTRPTILPRSTAGLPPPDGCRQRAGHIAARRSLCGFGEP